MVLGWCSSGPIDVLRSRSEGTFHMALMDLWRSLVHRPPRPYRLARLVDCRRRQSAQQGGLHFVCDIDKTYLETEFESVLRMARIAFEAAVDKITVAGAADVLKIARWGSEDQARPADASGDDPWPRALHFVSSSPPQLRAVLEEKMALDGLDWSSDTFKNQAYNLRMGRMDLLRQHVAYKSLALLNLVASAADGSRFVLIGDNAESDAYIYSGVRLLLAGRLSATGFRGWLEASGVESSVAADLSDSLPDPRGCSVVSILIRKVNGYSFVAEPPLTDPIRLFSDYFEAALTLFNQGYLPATALWDLTRSFHNQHGMPLSRITEVLTLAASGAPPDVHQEIESALTRLGAAPLPAQPASTALTVTDAALDGLGETEILQHARAWASRLAARRGRRPEAEPSAAK